MEMLLIGVVILILSGLFAATFSRSPRVATVFGAVGTVTGCSLGIVPAVRVLLGGAPESLQIAWDAVHGAFRVELDSLSAFFLLPVLGLSALAAVYGGDYLLAFRRTKSLGSPWFFFNAFVTGMIMVLVAGTGLLFLVAWEIMSISAYCLVTFEHEKHDVRKAGWTYLIATHLGVAFLLIAFVLLNRYAGSLEFQSFRTVPPFDAQSSGLIFVLALIGFGTKAGFVPFHVWLPEAHPAAPSHVSALMSGVMIKMGIYGILRMLDFLGHPAPWWGLTLGAIGLLTAIVGISLALHQRDMKRSLAYSSIENVGLIALALGVGLWGLASHHAAIAILGMTAGLLHTWNHALLKGLMFLAAGSIMHGTATRDMEKLGGLMKRMPWTANAMMFGAVALAALPPLNGFVGKWLLYLSLIKCGTTNLGAGGLVALLSVGTLAMVGGLAVICFARLTGVVLLGSPRSQASEHAHESSVWMLGPMFVLIALCLTVAICPQAVTGMMHATLDNVLGRGAGQGLKELEAAQMPLRTVGHINAWGLIGIATLGAAFLVWLTRARRAYGPTWGCGYAKPTVRMQYTGRSFAEFMAEQLLPRFLRPKTTRLAPRGLFPAKSEFGSESPDPVRQKIYEPFFNRWANRCARLRILQQGKVHVYLVYIVLTVILSLTWVTVRAWLGAS